MTVTVEVHGKKKHEDDETFVVNLTTPTGGATILDAQGTGTIKNVDSQPTISIEDAVEFEVNPVNTPSVFNVTLSNPSDQTITVAYASADGTATVADLDYTAAKIGRASCRERA